MEHSAILQAVPAPCDHVRTRDPKIDARADDVASEIGGPATHSGRNGKGGQGAGFGGADQRGGEAGSGGSEKIEVP